MKKIIISLSLLFATIAATAQSNYDTVLQQIEGNNTTLAALRRQIEAEKLGNRTGILPGNPEVEFNYLWGSPAAIGKRYDFSVSQTFDFPTAYAHRSKIAGLQNANAELSYKAERISILLSAKQICIGLAYYNALAEEYAVRLQNAERIAEAFKLKLEQGETNILEYNKAQLNLTTLQAEVAQIEAERIAQLTELRKMNGSKEIAFPAETYPIQTLPPDFETWYASAEAKNPVLQYVRGQIEISRQDVKLNRALGLPKFSAGYMSEKVASEQFQGIMLGMSIPLWENKNRIKQAKAQTLAAEAALEDSKVQFYNLLQSLYLKAATLQQNARKLRQSLSDNSNEPYLKKALDAGELSLLNYLLEVEFHYDTINKMLEAERDCKLATAELWAVEL